MSTLQNTDLFAVHRGTETYKVNYGDIMAGVALPNVLEYKGGADPTKPVPSPTGGLKVGMVYILSPSGTIHASWTGVAGLAARDGQMAVWEGAKWELIGENGLSQPDATETVKGIVELATAAETTTGTDNTRAVHPAGLKVELDKLKLWDRTGTVLSPTNAGDVVNISAGTAALPGLTPVGDPDTGIYSPGADQVAISTNGTGRLFVDASGNVEIAGTGKRIRGDFSNPTHANRLSLQTSTTDGSTSIFAIPNGAGSGASYVVANASDPTNCSFGQLLVNNFEVDLVSNALGSGTALPLRLRTIGPAYISAHTNDIERLRIDSSGRFLVGTPTARSNFFNATFTPGFQIEADGTDARMASIVCNATSAAGSYFILGKTRSASLGGTDLVSAEDEIGSVDFQAADGSGLVRAASIAAAVDGTAGANDMPGRLAFYTTSTGASAPTERMRIRSNGDIFFNTISYSGEGGVILQDGTNGGRQLRWNRVASANPTYALAFVNAGSTVGSISYTNTATTYSTSSDYRLKENIAPVTDGITRLQQLKPSRFNFIAEPGHTVDGFIAHEAQAVVPECATGTKDAVDDDGNPVYQGIDQSKLVPLLTAALQEVIGEIESLKARVAALETP